MTLSNVKLILTREIRDQLRDRRTLFMIAVLPILLYPLLGMSMLQIAQFMRDQSTRVLVVGAKSLESLAGLPPLFENQKFAERLFVDGDKAKLLELHFAPDEPSADGSSAIDPRTAAHIAVQAGKYEAALYFPPNFATRLDAFHTAIRRRVEERFASRESAEGTVPLQVPSPEIIYSTANEKSPLAFTRLSAILHRWTQNIGDDNLKASGVPAITARPFSLESADVADQSGHRDAALWSKILPVMLLLWALTGAFYPAVDLCAGEKERGTLETLLSSPAQRSEIVVGKLLTIMLFSIVTAVLNLASMAITGWMVLSHLQGFSLPPPTAIAALAVALVPIAALFSALCLALAAFARSTREGQYYLMPLLLITMPLVILPMSPGVELNLGNSLIPVTGVVLLLRSVLEGDYWHALQFSPMVVAVTLIACLLSIRWAVDQFNSESVLFRESERLDMGLWLRHLLRDRQPTPTAAAAVGCGVLILVMRFFVSFSAEQPGDFEGFARIALTTQLAVIAAPALIMAIVLTSSPRQTLLLKWPPWLTIPAAAVLAVALHPMANVLQVAVTQLYPVSENTKPVLQKMEALLHQANPWALLLVIAIVPAICEELAFRGFILSGFRHLGHKWRAIVYSALFFGLTHGILQQSLIASLVGVVIAYLAVQSGSLLPSVVFHLTHNALAVASSRITPETLHEMRENRIVGELLHDCRVHDLVHAWVRLGDTGGCVFQWPAVIAGSMLALLLLVWFAVLPCAKSPEEALEEAIERAEK
jgi:sodium transport system permease protein